MSHWQIPEAHFLEAWSDARAFDGTVSIVQPLIAPFYGGRSAHEVLATLSDRPERSAYQIVREHWQKARAARIRILLAANRSRRRDGKYGVADPHAHSGGLDRGIRGSAPRLPLGGFEISFRLDPTVLRRSFQQQLMAAGAP